MRLIAAVVATLAVSPAAGVPSGAGRDYDPRHIAGTWTLDTWLTDPGDQIQREIAADFGPRNLYDITPRRPAARNAATGGAIDSLRSNLAARPLLNADDNRKIQGVVDAIQTPATVLTITQADEAVTIVDPSRAPRTFHTNGSHQTQAFDAGPIESTARWDGPQLLTRYHAPHGVALEFGYMLVDSDTHLLVRISVRTPEGDTAPYVIRHVYDRSGKN